MKSKVCRCYYGTMFSFGWDVISATRDRFTVCYSYFDLITLEMTNSTLTYIYSVNTGKTSVIFHLQVL